MADLTEEETARAIRDAQHMPPSCDFPQCECGYECEREDLSVSAYKDTARAVLALVRPAIEAAVWAERAEGLRKQTTALAQAQDFRRLWEDTQREALGALQHAEQFMMAIGQGDGTDGARIRRSIAAIRSRTAGGE